MIIRKGKKINNKYEESEVVERQENKYTYYSIIKFRTILKYADPEIVPLEEKSIF